jgi:hypothetical protein
MILELPKNSLPSLVWSGKNSPELNTYSVTGIVLKKCEVIKKRITQQHCFLRKP